MGLFILGLFFMVYGLFCIVTGIFKIPVIWKMAKVQGFVKFLGTVGTQIFFSLWGILAIAVGYWLAFVR